MLCTLIMSRTVFQCNMIVACSRHSISIRSSDLVLRSLLILFLMTGGHGAWCQHLSPGNHDPHPVRHVSPGTVQT